MKRRVHRASCCDDSRRRLDLGILGFSLGLGGGGGSGGNSQRLAPFLQQPLLLLRGQVLLVQLGKELAALLRACRTRTGGERGA